MMLYFLISYCPGPSFPFISLIFWKNCCYLPSLHQPLTCQVHSLLWILHLSFHGSKSIGVIRSLQVLLSPPLARPIHGAWDTCFLRILLLRIILLPLCLLSIYSVLSWNLEFSHAQAWLYCFRLLMGWVVYTPKIICCGPNSSPSACDLIWK